MEPVTLISSLVLSILNLSAAEKQHEAREAYRGALRDEKDAYGALKLQSQATESARDDLLGYRLANVRWMLPRIQAAFAQAGASTAGLFDGFESVLSDLGERQMQALVEAALASIPHLDFDGKVGLAPLSKAALVVRALQDADALGVMTVPLLRGTLGDALARLPVDGASAWAGTLGPTADLSMSNALAAPLLVISFVQLTRRRSTTATLLRDTDKLLDAATAHRAKRTDLRRLEGALHSVNGNQQEASYQAFRAAMVAQAVCDRSDELPPSVTTRALSRLRSAYDQYRRAITQDLPDPTRRDPLP